jgi:hypothetical protein
MNLIDAPGWLPVEDEGEAPSPPEGKSLPLRLLYIFNRVLYRNFEFFRQLLNLFRSCVVKVYDVAAGSAGVILPRKIVLQAKHEFFLALPAFWPNFNDETFYRHPEMGSEHGASPLSLDLYHAVHPKSRIVGSGRF